MKIFLHHISRLYTVDSQGKDRLSGNEMASAGNINDAWVLIDSGKIAGTGTMQDIPADLKADQAIDCSGRLVLPGFADSHTHLVFAKSRHTEYVDRIRGLSYEEIARRGGGILNSAKRLQETSEEELLISARDRVWEILSMGTTSVEIKSGYGLTLKDELKMLRVARRLGEMTPLKIRTTFLGAHAIPAEYKEKREDYIRLILDEMIPQVAEEKLADFVDVFCDRGFFTVDETARILEKGAEYGLKPKIHANELDYSGGVQVGTKYQALSVDHLECVGEDEIRALKDSATVATVLPSTAYFLSLEFAPARKMIDAGLAVALATDYNPGSSPSGSMSFILSLASTRMKMLPEEALVAATLNGACAMGISDRTGSIEKGKDADIIITKPAEALAEIPYWFGKSLIDKVICNGVVYEACGIACP